MLSILHCASRGAVSTRYACSLISPSHDDAAAAIAAVTSLMQSKIPSSSPAFPSFTSLSCSSPSPPPPPPHVHTQQNRAKQSSTNTTTPTGTEREREQKRTEEQRRGIQHAKPHELLLRTTAVEAATRERFIL